MAICNHGKILQPGLRKSTKDSTGNIQAKMGENGRFLWENGERGKMVENGVFRRVYKVSQVPYGVFTYTFLNLFFVPSILKTNQRLVVKLPR